MVVENTSLEAYMGHLESGNNITQKEELLFYFDRSKGSLCSRQLSEWTGIDRSTVNSRLGELEKDEYIIYVGSRVYPPTNKRYKFYRRIRT